MRPAAARAARGPRSHLHAAAPRPRALRICTPRPRALRICAAGARQAARTQRDRRSFNKIKLICWRRGDLGRGARVHLQLSSSGELQGQMRDRRPRGRHRGALPMWRGGRLARPGFRGKIRSGVTYRDLQQRRPGRPGIDFFTQLSRNVEMFFF